MAKFIDWTQSFQVGHAAVDEDHARLVDIINRLYDARNSTNEAEIVELFLELENFTMYHFGHEEQMMDQIGYERSEIHRRLHTHLLDQLRVFRRHYLGQTDKVGITADLSQFLWYWLVEHIVREDRFLAAALLDKEAMDNQSRAAVTLSP